MKNSSSTSTGCERTKCGWMVGTPHPIPIASRRRSDAPRDGLDGVVADGAPWCLPWNQPRDGVAVRGGTRNARAEGECGREGAGPDRVWPHAGDRWRGAGCRISRHGSAAPNDPLSCRCNPLWFGDLLPDKAFSPALGPHAGGFPRPDDLVVSDGLGTRGGVD